MPILSNSAIDRTCRDIMQVIDNDYSYYSDHIHILYDYGCRIGEVFNYRLSYSDDDNQLKIIAQKNNNVRQLTAVNFETSRRVENIVLSNDQFWLNEKNFQRIIKKSNPYRNLKCGGKNIGAHLFRHNWIRKQIEAGKQFTEIDLLLGYTSQSVRDTYLAATIHY